MIMRENQKGNNTFYTLNLSTVVVKKKYKTKKQISNLAKNQILKQILLFH